MRDIDRVARNWNAEDCNTNATTDARLCSRRHFWTPYPGHPDAEDLRSFHADAFTVFEDDLPDVYKLPPREGE